MLTLDLYATMGRASGGPLFAYSIVPLEHYLALFTQIIFVAVVLKGAIFALLVPHRPISGGFLRGLGIAFIAVMGWLQLAKWLYGYTYPRSNETAALVVIIVETIFLHWLCNRQEKRPATWMKCTVTVLFGTGAAFAAGYYVADKKDLIVHGSRHILGSAWLDVPPHWRATPHQEEDSRLIFVSPDGRSRATISCPNIIQTPLLKDGSFEEFVRFCDQRLASAKNSVTGVIFAVRPASRDGEIFHMSFSGVDKAGDRIVSEYFSFRYPELITIQLESQSTPEKEHRDALKHLERYQKWRKW